MSSGHASHKGTSIKPNTNANSQGDVDPEDALPDEGYPFDAEVETTGNPAALQRSGNQSGDEAEEE